MKIPIVSLESTPSEVEKKNGREASEMKLNCKVLIKKGIAPSFCEDNEVVEGDNAEEIPEDGKKESIVLNEIDWDGCLWELSCLGYVQTWYGGLSAPDNWHSIGLTVKHSSWTNDKEMVNLAGIDLVIDGANRRRGDDTSANVSKDLTGAVVHWLTSIGSLGEEKKHEPTPGMLTTEYFCESTVIKYDLPSQIQRLQETEVKNRQKHSVLLLGIYLLSLETLYRMTLHLIMSLSELYQR